MKPHMSGRQSFQQSAPAAPVSTQRTGTGTHSLPGSGGAERAANHQPQNFPQTQSGTQEQNQLSPPPPKRRRIGLACDSCRNRKTRCNGTRPACNHCLELGLKCVYQGPAPVPQGNQLSTVNYDDRLSSIENTLKLLLDSRGTQPGNTTAPNVLPPGLSVDDRRTTAMFDEDQNVTSIASDVQCQQDPVDDSLDGITVIPNALGAKATFFGPSSNITFLRHISDAVSATFGSSDQIRQPRSDLREPLISTPGSPRASAVNLSSVSSRPVNVHILPSDVQALHLMDLFFADTGLVFPYFHNEEMYQSYRRARRDNFSGVTDSVLCLLNVIFAWATYTSVKDMGVSHEVRLAESDVYYARAKLLASQFDLEHANVQTVQGLLLLNQYCIATQRSARIWNLHGSTVTVAMQIGLHSQSALKNFSVMEAEVRKRTWYGCIVLDRTLSMTFGRPPAIPNNLVIMPLPFNRSLEKLAQTPDNLPSAAPADPSDTVCIFTATTELYCLQGTIIEELYANNMDNDTQITLSEVLKRTLTLEEKLSSWRCDLPDRLVRKPWLNNDLDSIALPSTDSTFDRLSVVLALRYRNTRLLLHRSALTFYLRFTRTQAAATADSPDRHDYQSYLLKMNEGSIAVCEQDAMEIVDIISWSTTHSHLQSAWWFSTYYCFSAALVLFSCIIIRINRTEQPQDNVNTGMIVKLGDKFRIAVEALSRFGNNSSIQRAKKTLGKLLRIYTNFVQNQVQGVSTDLASNTTHIFGLQPQTSAGDQGTDASRPRMDLDGMVFSAAPNATSANGYLFQFPDADFDFDLFTDLAGVDLERAALLAS